MSAAGATAVADPVAGQAPRAIALRLRALAKSYGPTTAISGVELDVHERELVTLLGPSGCGKSTILKLIAGFIAPSRGEVVIAGRDVSRLRPRERGVGMVFQDYALFPHLTALENVAYGLKMRGWKRAARRQRATELLEAVGLAGFEDRRPSRMSGGQQQRVAVARALAWDPTILLMDEPLSALDREMRVQMAQQLRDIHDRLGATTVMVTHDRDEAMRLSDRVALLQNGRLDCVATPRVLYTDPPTPFAATFFGAHNLLTVDLVDWSDAERRAVVRLDGVVLRLRASADGPSPEGERAILTVPREAIRIVGADAAEPDAIACQVVGVTYLGDVMQVRAVVGGQSVHVNQPADGRPLEPGAARLVFDCGRSRVHPGPGTGSAPAPA